MILSKFHRITQINDYREMEEWCCIVCGNWFDLDNIVFVRDDGTLSVEFGKPHCIGCCPPEPEPEYA